MVARLRGAVFSTLDEDDLKLEPTTDDDLNAAKKALADVSAWLGFESDTSSYGRCLHDERERIFARARD